MFTAVYLKKNKILFSMVISSFVVPLLALKLDYNILQRGLPCILEIIPV